MRWRTVAVMLLAGAVGACGQAAPPIGVSAGGNGGDATGGAAAGGPGSSGESGRGGGAGVGVTSATLQYNGAVVMPGRIEISAPILPRTTVIYAPFPSTLDGEKAMAHEAALLFDWLLVQCAPLYPMITLDSGGAGLSADQLAVNYDETGRCAYEQYVAKPYWIPKLIDDVDICGTEMGPSWRLLTEADLASLTEADYRAFTDVWNHHVVGGTGLGFFFSSTQVWVRANDGSIKAGTLAPGAGTTRVTPLVLPYPTSLTDHYEGSLGLRCIRRT